MTSRGNGRARIFFDDDDRRGFLRKLRDNVEPRAIFFYAMVFLSGRDVGIYYRGIGASAVSNIRRRVLLQEDGGHVPQTAEARIMAVDLRLG